MTNLIIPLFPEEPDKSFGFYKDFLHLCFNELLWLSFFLMIAWIFLFHTPLLTGVWKIESRLLEKKSLSVAVVILATLTLTILVAMLALRGFPNSADEYVYLYQARTLSEGRFYQEAHPLVDFFHFNTCWIFRLFG